MTLPRTAEELAHAEERLRAAMEGSLDAVFMLEAVRDAAGTITDFRFVDCNQRGAEMVSIPRESLVGGLLCELIPINRTGGFFDRYVRVVETREPLEESFPIDAHGFLPTWLWHQVVPVGDGIAITSRDVSHEHHATIQMHTAQRLASLGRMAGGVAHDFNNLLTIITAGISHLQASPVLRDEELEVAHDIAEAADRAARITRQLQAFSQRQVAAPTAIALADALHEVMPLLRRLLPATVRLVTDVPAGLPRITADAAQVEQLLLNLTANARDAMPQGGTLTIRGRLVHLEAPERYPHGTLPAGAWVRLDVTDTGEGITAAVMPHIFDPFFTTRARGSGSGLGLSVSLGIVQQHGGTMAVASRPGEGTTVTACWPPLPAAADPRRPTPTSTPATALEPSVVLVDDESLLLSTLARALERAGLHCLAAGSGAEALTLLKEPLPGRRRVLVTDVQMPGMTGIELAAQARARHPDLPVIYISGQSEELTPLLSALGPAESFLAKPFGVQQLVQRIREAAQRTVAG